MTSSIRVSGRFSPPNADTFQPTPSWLAGPPVGSYEPPTHFSDIRNRKPLYRMMPSSSFASTTKRFEDRPNLENRPKSRGAPPCVAHRDPHARFRGPGYRQPDQTSTLLGSEGVWRPNSPPTIVRRGVSQPQIGGVDRPLSAPFMGCTSAAVEADFFAERAHLGPGAYADGLERNQSTFSRAASSPQGPGSRGAGSRGAGSQKSRGAPPGHMYGTAAFANSGRAKAIIPNDDRYVTEVPGRGDTLLGPQTFYNPDPRWNGDTWVSVQERQGRRLRLKEGAAINKSLSSLGDVIGALSSGAKHVPYRNAKLTHVLQNALAGSSKTLMFVNVSPSAKHHCESLSSLRFAAKVNATQVGPAEKRGTKA